MRWRWWIERRQCRHDKLVGTLLKEEPLLFGTLLVMQGWPPRTASGGYYIRTQPGSHTYTLPLQAIRGRMVFAVLTLGALNQTPIYGVMGFQVGKEIVGYHDFPLEMRLRMQMSPHFQDIVLMFETELLPRFENLFAGKER